MNRPISSITSTPQSMSFYLASTHLRLPLSFYAVCDVVLVNLAMVVSLSLFTRHYMIRVYHSLRITCLHGSVRVL